MLAAAQPSWAAPGLTLTVPENQRANKTDTFGVQVEFFLRNNLAQTGLVQLTTFEVTRQLAGAPPHTDSRYITSGSYQRVGRLIFLTITLKKPDHSTTIWEQTFEQRQSLEHLEQLGVWILKQMGLVTPWPHWSLPQEEGALLYTLRLQRYQTNDLPTIEDGRTLFRSFAGAENEQVIGEVALELLLSVQSDMGKGASLLKRVDRYLRKALVKHPKSGELLTLLALNYHLSGSYSNFIEKTSVEALTYAPNNELAWFLASLATGLSTGLGKERLQRFVALHPLAWNPRLKYLSGALDQELKKAATILKQINHPDPYQLRNP